VPEVDLVLVCVLSTLPLRGLPPKGNKIKNSFYKYINYDKVSPTKLTTCIRYISSYSSSDIYITNIFILQNYNIMISSIRHFVPS